MKRILCGIIAVLLLLSFGCASENSGSTHQRDMWDDIAENRPISNASYAESEQTAADSKSILAKSVMADGGEVQDEYAWYYHLQTDGTAMLDCCVNLIYHMTIVLPEKVDGYAVTALAQNVFRDEDLSMYTQSITIPDCITRIEGNPFDDWMASYKIIVSDTHPTLEIKDGALFDKREKRLICAFATAEGERVPEGTEIIEDYALSRSQVCSWEITIPASVKKIGHNPFLRRYMKHITVAEGNPFFEMRDGFLFDKREQRLIIVEFDKYEEELNSRPRKRETVVCEIPNGTKIIDDFAFYGLSEMLGKITFSIPNSVKEIGVNPFGCDEEFELSPDNTAFEITGGVLYSKADKRVICGSGYKTPTALPQGTEIIGDYASIWIEGDYAIPDSIREIGTYALYGDGTIRLPNRIRRIGSYFNCNIADEKLILSGNVSVGSHAFSCSLTEIVIQDGNSVLHSHMLETASAADTLLELVSIGKGETVIGFAAFGMCQAEFTVYHNTYAEQFVMQNIQKYRYAD